MDPIGSSTVVVEANQPAKPRSCSDFGPHESAHRATNRKPGSQAAIEPANIL